VFSGSSYERDAAVTTAIVQLKAPLVDPALLCRPRESGDRLSRHCRA
jgi:hypothetical protein